MGKYRKKPIEVEASEWIQHGDHPAVEEYPGTGVCCECEEYLQDHGWVHTLEGGHVVCPGDWIITGVKGENYPCKPVVFALTYDEVET